MSRSVLLVLALTGCPGFVQLMNAHDGPSRADPNARWVWQGPECPEDRRIMPREHETDDERAHTLLCTEWPGFNGGGADMDLEERHARVDDRRPDAFALSVMILSCARFCTEHDRLPTAMVAGLAEKLDFAALARDVEHLPWSPMAKAFYVARTRDAIAAVTAVASGFDARRKAMYLELPKAIRDERAAYFQAHARLYATLDSLAPDLARVRQTKRKDDGLVDRLVALRAAYFADCPAPDCRFDPFIVEVEKTIVQLALVTGDEFRASLEGSLFAEKSALRTAYAPTIYRALRLAMHQQEELYEAYERAKRGGNDPTTLAARFGDTPPIHVTADSAWKAYDDAPGLLRGEHADSVVGNVAAIRPHGTTATIAFEDVVSSYELTDCVETNRVDGIDRDGRLIYRQDCRSVGTHVDRRPTPPIEVPRGETVGLRPGEQVTALIRSDRSGGIVAVHDAKARLVQFRAHRLRPDAPHPAVSPSAEVDATKRKK